MRPTRSLSSWGLIASLIATAAGAQTPPGATATEVDLFDGSKKMTLSTELAITPESRALGLMFREKLPAGTGMLFLFDEIKRVDLWMKNCKINIDAAFFGPEGKFLELVKMVPCTAEPCAIYSSASDRVETLIELPDGWLKAQKLNEAELRILNYASLKNRIKAPVKPLKSAKRPSKARSSDSR